MSPRQIIRFCAVAAVVLTGLAYGFTALQAHAGTAAAVLALASLVLCPLPGMGQSLTALGLRNPLLAPEWDGVGVNKKASLGVPLGSAYHDILCHVQTAGVDMTIAQIKSMIDSIVIKLNGVPVQEWTPTDLDVANSTNGAEFAMVNGYFRLYFSEPANRTMEGEERGAWGTIGLESFTVEVKFNGTAVTPTIEAWGNTEEGQNRPIRAFPIRHVRRYGALPVVNGVTQFSTLLREVGLFYRRIHFLSALITSVKIESDKKVKWDNLPRAVVAEYMRNRQMALQANVYTVAFDMTSQQLTDMLPSFLSTNPPVIVPDFRVTYTGSGAGNVDVVTEQYQILK